jgi:hypothetical protein
LRQTDFTTFIRRVLSAAATLTTSTTTTTPAPIVHTTVAPPTCAILESFGGHYYQVFPGRSTQPQAKLAASQMTYNGLQGHLVTITSQAEQDFVTELTKNYGTRFWIDGERNGTSVLRFFQGPEKGTAVIHTYWEPGQPNNSGGNQNCIEFSEYGKWNDWACDNDRGFIVEYEVCFEPWCTRMSCAARFFFCFVLLFGISSLLLFLQIGFDIPVIPSFDSYN